MSTQRWYDPDLQWDTEIFRDHFFGIAVDWDLNMPKGPMGAHLVISVVLAPNKT